eukprot:gene5112-biopygen12973
MDMKAQTKESARTQAVRRQVMEEASEAQTARNQRRRRHKERQQVQAKRDGTAGTDEASEEDGESSSRQDEHANKWGQQYYCGMQWG